MLPVSRASSSASSPIGLAMAVSTSSGQTAVTRIPRWSAKDFNERVKQTTSSRRNLSKFTVHRVQACRTRSVSPSA